MSAPETDRSPTPAAIADAVDMLTGAAGNGGGAPGTGLRAWGLRHRALAVRLAWPAGFAVAGVVLFLCYLRLSRTQPVISDAASNALQAWDMLHGNLLLHGWTVSDVSFYTTELPEYMAVEAVRGLSADVVHVSAAITYTLLVLLAALLAKGKATGRQAAVRMLIAGGIMLAPQLGSGTFILLLAPDHVGTQVPLLAVWLLIDRAGRRWWVPVVAGIVLAVVQVADRMAVTVAVAPLLVVCGVRAYRGLVQRREPLVSRWYELSLAAAAVISVEAASLASKLIASHGGYTTLPLKSTFASTASMPAHFWLTVEGVLGLYGADFFGQQVGVDTAITLLHLAGLAMAVWAMCIAVRRFFRCDDLVVQVLTAAIVLDLASYTFSVLPGTYWATRDIAAVLPLGAVLAGRLLTGRLIGARLVPAMAVVLLCYAFALGHGVVQPAVPASGQDLAGWLAAHHLTSGLADYGQANDTTLDSGGHIQVREPTWPGGRAAPGNYESDASWYNPRLHYANFVVALTEPNDQKSVLYRDAKMSFGHPAQIYYFRHYVIMTWHKNLLADLR
jgi:hypothetical protein